MHPRRRPLTTAALVACATLSLAACTNEVGDDSGEASPSEEASDSGAGQGPDRGAAEAPDPADALATVAIPIGFIEGGELEVAVNSFEVTGELLRMALTFTASLPSDVEEVAIGAVLSSDENAPATGISPELIDPVNLKAYEVVAGDITSGTRIDLVDGSPRTIVFYYAAPQDDVETFDVQLSSESPALTDVPFEP